MEHHRAAIEASLHEFWEARSLEEDLDPNSVESLADPLESVAAVDALLPVETIVGMEIPAGEVVRAGGYQSREQFVKELTQAVIDYVAEKSK